MVDYNYHIEGNFVNGKIWRIQHMNIFGTIKFSKLVKPARAPARFMPLQYREISGAIAIYVQKV